MPEKEYVCAYPHCLHHGEKVLASESVVIGKKHYHWDCATLKQEIQDCANTYIEYTEDLLALGSAILVLMLFTFLFAVAAIVLSGIGIAQRAKYRLNGFAIAGLVIACLSIFLMFMLFAAGA